jgi:para-nitrobenzyl esterase
MPMSAIVSIRDGRLEGDEHDGIKVFKGIPFAAPTVGALRWAPPARPTAWNGVRDARQFGMVAHQNRTQNGALAAMVIDQPQSEDCLTLNVWAPVAHGAPRPVMVWIHGGAFTIGSGAQPIYDGSTLVRRGDAVVVTINYRLGPLGFLRLADVTGGKIASTGNEGMLDQIAALRWVRENIAEFGGDPGNVTIFGESAGGMSVGALLGMPQAHGLFHKAIPQSGACNTAANVERANRVAERVLARLGVSASNPDAIRALKPEQLLKGTFLDDGVTPDPSLGMAYQPVADGAQLPRAAIEMVADGSAAGVAIMAGSTLEEWKLFGIMDPSLATLDKDQLAARVARRIPGETAGALIQDYEDARRRRGDSVEPRELFCAIETDRAFRMPAVQLAETQSRREPRVYSYLFIWKSPALRGALGACHALELGFVFGTNHLEGMQQFAGGGPAAERLATQMQDAWLAFARSGDPSCESAGAWPAYAAARRSTMIFGETGGAADAPYDDERRAWDRVPPGVIGAL